jgi:transposase
MPWERLSRSILGAELKLISTRQHRKGYLWEVEKLRKGPEICPKCAQPSTSRYGVVQVTVRQENLWGLPLWFKIKKHRYLCKTCRKPFTEPVPGVMPRMKTTQRYRKSLLSACQLFKNLSKVRREYRCSSSLVYKVLYEQLEIKLRERKGALWPTVVGIDEHFFTRRRGWTEFVTVFTDLKKRKMFEMVEGKDKKSILQQVEAIPGRERVQVVVIDLSNGYRSLVRELFPNARIVADKFHALRLITPSLIKTRKEIQGFKQDMRMRRLLLKNRKNLDYDLRFEVDKYLKEHPKLDAIYRTKERLHELYRCKGIDRGYQSMIRLVSDLEKSPYEEIQRLKNTLKNWGEEILNYFELGYTNALTEALNRTAKLVQANAYGYKSFRNYRLRTLSACT